MKCYQNMVKCMYDKVKLWIGRTAAGSRYEAIASRLDAPKEQTDLSTGEITLYGGLDGLRVALRQDRITVCGSLPKFLYKGSNIPALDRHTTAQAIERLSDALHVDMACATVSEMEFGRTFVMQHPVSAYLVRLGEMERRNREVKNGSLYYTHNGKEQPDEVYFYDKGKEARKSGMPMPVGFEGANLLRYEIRYKGRLPQQMNCPKVEASTLAEKGFYGQMVRLYLERYLSIKKINMDLVDMGRIKNVNDAINVLLALCLHKLEQDEAALFLEEMKASNVFNDKKYYTRYKNRIKDAMEKAGKFTADTLIKELDDEVKNACIYA